MYVWMTYADQILKRNKYFIVSFMAVGGNKMVC